MSQIMHERVQERLRKLRMSHCAMRLEALLSEASQAEWTFLEMIDRLLTEEIEAKQNKRVAMSLQIAHFPGIKTLEDFDFQFQPSVDKKRVKELATGHFVGAGENVLLLGPPGVGKTHLAIAIGRSVIAAGYSVLFTTATEILGALAKAENERKLDDKLAFYLKPKLLIIDEMGYLPLEQRSAHLLFQLVTRRYEKGSTLVTTNRPVTQWGKMLGDEATATAMLDRLLHHSIIMTIKADSYRLKHKRKAGILDAASIAKSASQGGQF